MTYSTRGTSSGNTGSECEILLDQSRSVLARLLARADPASSASKQARRLIRAIDRAARLAGPGET